MEPQAYLTIAEVAAELGITRAGVYKLVQRDQLKAIRRTERGMRVSRLALDAYRRRVEDGRGGPARGATRMVSLLELREEFVRETEMQPEEWERRWKAEEFEDSAQNMRLAIRALALRAAEHQAQATAAPQPWLIAVSQQQPR